MLINKISEHEEQFNDLVKKGLMDHNVFTPYSLCREILNCISDLKSKNILVLYSYEIAYLLVKEYNCDPQSITLMGNSGNLVKITLANKLGINYCDLDWLERTKSTIDMKFDVIVGNPPYQNGNNSCFYKQFVELSKEYADIVAMIVPSSNFSNAKSFQNLEHYSYKGVAFKDIQTVVTWFIWRRDYIGPCIIHGKNGSISTDKILVSPTDNIHIFSIANRLASHKGFDIYGGKLLRRDVIEDSDGIWCIWSGGKSGQDFDKCLVSNSQKALLSGFGLHKVVFSEISTTTTIGPVKYAEPDHGCANSSRYIPVNNKAEADNLINYLNSKLIKYLMPTIKGTSAHNTKTVFNNIPKIDLKHSWTDNDLYEYFNLTQEEIDYIESTFN